MDKVAKVWAWECDPVHVLPQHSAPRNPGLVNWGNLCTVGHTAGAQRPTVPMQSKDRVAQSRGFQGLRVTTGCSRGL